MQKIEITEKNKYCTKDITKWIRQTLREKYPTNKFSVTHEYFSGGNVSSAIDVALLKSDLRIIKSIDSLNEDNLDCVNRHHYSLEDLKHTYARTYHELNYLTLLSEYNNEWNHGIFLTKEGHLFLQDVVKIMCKYNWDKSDSQTDYVDMNYYMGISLGKYDKPFIDGDNVKRQTYPDCGSANVSYVEVEKTYAWENPSKITCNWCGWVGTENSIILKDSEEGELEEFCPKCDKEGYLMDLGAEIGKE